MTKQDEQKMFASFGSKQFKSLIVLFLNEVLFQDLLQPPDQIFYMVRHFFFENIRKILRNNWLFT